MKCHKILTYYEESHDDPFYILAEDDRSLLHALNVIKASKEVTSFEVDNKNGNAFYSEVFGRVYPGMDITQLLKGG